MNAAPSSSSLLAGDVDPDEHDDAREADQQPDQPAARRALRAVEAQRQHRDQQRHRGDDDRRERGVDVLLAGGDQRERDRDLQERVGGQPAAPAAQRPERPGAVREHEQHRRRQHDARPGHERRREPVVDRDLDEQVRDPPEDRHRREPRPRPCRHRPSLSASGSTARRGPLPRVGRLRGAGRSHGGHVRRRVRPGLASGVALRAIGRSIDSTWPGGASLQAIEGSTRSTHARATLHPPYPAAVDVRPDRHAPTAPAPPTLRTPSPAPAGTPPARPAGAAAPRSSRASSR